ncbi:hypothetical protein MXB_5336 [Myxobolus squamalis]|nr:hypothetical protein MXB_5336 [Myxobolus squamalis]
MPSISGFKLTLEVVGFFQLPVDKIAMKVYLIEFAHFLHQLNNGYIPLMVRLDTTPELSCQLALKLYRLKATTNLCALSNSIMEAMSDLVNYDKLQTHTTLVLAALLVIDEIMVFLMQPLSINLTLKEKKIIEKSGATEELSSYFQNNVDKFIKNWQKICLKLIYNLFFNTKQRQFQDYMKKMSPVVGNLVHIPVLLLARIISSSYGFINNLTLCIFWEMICNVDDSISKSASVGFLVACEKWPKETNAFLSQIFKRKNTHEKFILVKKYRYFVMKSVENLFNARYLVYVIVNKSTLWMKLPSVEFGPSTPPIGVEFQAYRIEDSSWSESTFISTGLPKIISEEEQNDSNINEEINIELLMSGNIKERTAFEEKSLLLRQKYLLFSSNLLLDAYLYFPYYSKRSGAKPFILASEIIEDGFIANVSSFLIFQCALYLINSGIKSQYNISKYLFLYLIAHTNHF